MQEQSVRRKLSFYRSSPLKLLPILLDVSLPSIHRQSLLRVTSHVRSYRRHDEIHAWTNIHIYVPTHTHICICCISKAGSAYVLQLRSSLLLYTIYTVCTAKRCFRKRHTYSHKTAHRGFAIANINFVTFEKISHFSLHICTRIATF